MFKLPDAPIWVVSTRKTGHINQCLALLDVLGVKPNRTILISGKSAADTKIRKLVLFFESSFGVIHGLFKNRAPKKFVIIASGRSVAWLCRFWRWFRKSNLFIIYIGAPNTRIISSDIIVTSFHDIQDGESYDKSKYNMLIKISGVLSRKSESVELAIDKKIPVKLAYLVVLVGGKNNAYDFDGELFKKSIKKLKEFIDAPKIKIDVIISRRTFKRTEDFLRSELVGSNCRIVDVADQSGYARAMSEATHFVVSPDSITMVSECCSLNRPVYILSMDTIAVNTAKTKFIQQFLDVGYVEKFDDFAWKKVMKTLPNQADEIAGNVKEALSDWYLGRNGIRGSVESGTPKN